MALALERGHYPASVWRLYGVHPRTVKRWLAMGKRNPDSIHGKFRRAVSRASAAGEVALLELVLTAAPSDPSRAQWVLERRWPDRWGRHVGELHDLQRQVAELAAELARLTGGAG